MISAFSSWLSGMATKQRALDHSANNIANVSSNGFRPSRADFSEQPAGGLTSISA